MILSRDSAVQVAASFLNEYYPHFINLKPFSRLLEMYGDLSCLAVVGHPSLEGSANGKDIQGFLDKIDRVLQQRKIEITSVDSVPLPDGGVQVLSQVVLYLRNCKWRALHVFVLSPTAHRTSTFYISSEHLCFISKTDDIPPTGVKVLNPRQVVLFLSEERKRRQEAFDRRLEQEALEHQQHQSDQTPSRNSRQPSHEHTPAQHNRFSNLNGPSLPGVNNHHNTNNNKNHGASHEGLERGRLRGRDRRENHGDRPENDVKGGRQPPQPQQEHCDPQEQPRKFRERRGKADGERREEGTAAAPLETPPAPTKNRRERKPREERHPPAETREKPQSSNAAVEEKPKRKSRGGRKEGHEGEKPAPRSGSTTSVRITNVPLAVSTEVIQEVLCKWGVAPAKLYRFGRDHMNVVAHYNSEADAEKVYKLNTIMIEDASHKVVAFYP